MTENKEVLLQNLSRLHTTEMGVERIRKNLSLGQIDVVEWCRNKIESPQALITRSGKNWYIEICQCRLTVNAYSFTIITAHPLKH